MFLAKDEVVSFKSYNKDGTICEVSQQLDNDARKQGNYIVSRKAYAIRYTVFATAIYHVGTLIGFNDGELLGDVASVVMYTVGFIRLFTG